ncbi:MAG: hypothetical protein RhofKO_39810 [Rhodothermales bacterium]
MDVFTQAALRKINECVIASEDVEAAKLAAQQAEVEAKAARDAVSKGGEGGFPAMSTALANALALPPSTLPTNTTTFVQGDQGGEFVATESATDISDDVTVFAMTGDANTTDLVGVDRYLVRTLRTLPLTSAMAGATGEGVGDERAKLTAMLQTAAGQEARLRAGDYRLAGRIDINYSFVLNGERGTKLVKDHGSNGLRIEPDAEDAGTVTSATTGTITISGSGWTANEHAGKWVELATLQAQYRRVVSNTADTLTLDYALDAAPGAGVHVDLYTPIDYVIMRNIDMVGTTGSAGILIRYVKHVILDHCGSQGHSGNALAIYNCDRVDVIDSSDEGYSGCNFGVFVYNSDNVTVERVYAANNTSEYNIQLKDCRNSKIVNCITPGGFVGQNIKSSGMNRTYNCSIISGEAHDCAEYAFKMHALHNEGTTYHAENYQIIAPQSKGCGGGVQILQTTTAEFWGAVVLGGSHLESVTTALSLQCSNVMIICASFIRGAIRQLQIGDTASAFGVKNTLINCTFENGNWDGSNGPEGRMYGQSNVLRGCRFVHTNATSKSNRAIQEFTSGPADNNVYEDCEFVDPIAYADHILLTGTGSRNIERNRSAGEGEALMLVEMTTGTCSVGQVGYRSGSGSPLGSVTPHFVGEEYLDTSASAWYKSTSTGSNDWQPL